MTERQFVYQCAKFGGRLIVVRFCVGFLANYENDSHVRQPIEAPCSVAVTNVISIIGNRSDSSRPN